MTADEKAKMFKAIGYEENAVPEYAPIEYVAIKMNFKLIAMDVGLYKDNKELRDDVYTKDFQNLPAIIQLQFSMASALITQRPAASAISVKAGMKEMKMTGISRNDYTPILVESIISDEFNLLDIFFETNPLDSQCDQRIKVVARPLQIIYDAETIISLLDTFQPPTDVNLSTLEQSATSRLADFKERSATGMQYVIDQKSILDVDILLMPNILVVPHGGDYVKKEKSLLVVSLGQVHVTTKPHHRDVLRSPSIDIDGYDKSSILKSVMDNAYDTFVVELNDLQVLVALPHENWQQVLHLAVPTELHVLRPISLKVKAALCFIENDPRLPKIKVDIDVPALQVNITEDRVLEAISIGTNIPLPKSKEEPKPTLTRSTSSISNFINRELKKRMSSSQGKISVDEEIIQYTNVEVNFSLNEILIVLNQSKKLCEVPSGTATPFLTPDGGSEVMSQNDASELSLKLTTSSAETSQPILSLQVLQVEAYMAQRTFETVAKLK